MVLDKFPVANLLGQLVRQITQPLSKTIVKYAEKRPFLRKYVLIQLGRFYYWCEDKITQRKIPAVAKRKPVDDSRTMELGTKLLLEALVFGLLWSVIIYEAQKAAEKSYMAEQLKMQELSDLEAEKNRLMRRVENQVILTKQLKGIIVEYARQVGCTLPGDPTEKKGE
nr:PREDICTED: optic atrophy 3 protein homolog [Linepithema humile]